MKKALAIFLTLVMLFSTSLLAGCGSTSSSAAATGSTAQSGVPQQRTLNIVGSVRTYPGQEEAWAKLVSDFEAKYPDVKVTVRWQGNWDEVPQNMTASKLANEDVD
ncbi:MAG: hypothetical protein RSF73_10290, partial [Ruthenibacterium sp.]